LPFFYEKEGGFFISGAIKKFMYILVSKRVHPNILLSYSQYEICNTLQEINHPIIRECLNQTNLKDHLVVLSYADIGARTGLGSSGSFTVGLLNSLYGYLGKTIEKEELAELACHIQMNLLNQPTGKQDEYIATFGGLQCFDIAKNGKVTTYPLKISENSRNELEKNLIFFDTGLTRSASDILEDQKQVVNDIPEKIEHLKKIKNLGLRNKIELEKGNVDEFGYLMDEHWEEKKQTSKKISNASMDNLYSSVKKLGALGGKLIGAGGGGIFMLYTNDEQSKKDIRLEFLSKGMKEIFLPFEQSGTHNIVNLSEGVQ